MTLVELLAAARSAGLTLTAGPDGTLTVNGPRTAGHIARALLARKADVVPIVAFFAGTVTTLNWNRARLAPVGATCRLCGKPASLIDPYDPGAGALHKTCAEYSIRTGRYPGISRDGAA